MQQENQTVLTAAVLQEMVKRCRRTNALSAAGQHISLRECYRVVNNDGPFQVHAVQLIRNVVEEENKERIKRRE